MLAREMLVEDLTSRIMGVPENETVILQSELAGFGTGSKLGVWDLDAPSAPLPEEAITFGEAMPMIKADRKTTSTGQT